jgi:hypothetical protein
MAASSSAKKSSNSRSRSKGTAHPRSTSARSHAKANGHPANGLIEGPLDDLETVLAKAPGMNGLAKGALAVVAGTTVAALAGKAILDSRTRQKHLLGVPVPRRKDLTSMTRQVGTIAGHVEKASKVLGG